MKDVFRFLVLFAITLNAQVKDYEFLNPRPGSSFNTLETTITIREGSIVDVSKITQDLIIVSGSKSGNISGRIILADDGRTLVFKPSKPFIYGENINVTISKNLKNSDPEHYSDDSFNFQTIKKEQMATSISTFSDEYFPNKKQKIGAFTTNDFRSLPVPEIEIDTVNNPRPGTIFLATWDRNVPAKYANFIFVLDNQGNILDSVRVNGAPFDLRIQPNGYLSYAFGDFSGNVPGAGEKLRYLIMDDNITVIDSFEMKNGYPTDFHELQYLPNGHALIMSYLPITYDMSAIVPGGRPDASLILNIIQEQDKDKNVVFEWRNIDYIPITDSDADLTASRVNYSTLNAFEVDYDGNILASFRELSAIMKINRSNGEIMWNFGGKNNEFAITGEHEENAPYYFSRQHDITRLPNGNITIFDNGQFHKPPYSRGVEYEIDEINKTADMVSEFRYPGQNVFAAAAGNAQKYDDGGWFLGFGILHPQSPAVNVVESHPEGSIAFQLSLPKNVISYRTSKQLWKDDVEAPTVSIFESNQGNTYEYASDTINTGVSVEFILLDGEAYNSSTITRFPYGPKKPEFLDDKVTIYPVSVLYEGAAIYSQNAEFRFDLDYFPQIKDPQNTMVYWRNFANQGLFVSKSTTYDDVYNELVANLNNFGEIVFGVLGGDFTPDLPILYEPTNQQKLILQNEIAVRWTGRGKYDSFNLQVSTDSSFSTTLFSENTNLSYFKLTGLDENSKYFWRVNSEINGVSSDWSDVWSFMITDPYLDLSAPNGGESWAVGSSQIIRWETNILDSVIIGLENGSDVGKIIGTESGNLKAFQWNIESENAVDDNYRIHIYSQADTNLSDRSSNSFSIIDTVSSFQDNVLPKEFELSQNYPNPFNPSTKISFSIPESGGKILQTSLKIYDALGNEIATLLNRSLSSGKHSVDFNTANLSIGKGGLTSGVYFYKLQSGDFIKVKKMLVLK
ncbi:MAG: aryl-sulfate sulfotransferase [Melioribacteraceae bacterium]|nr:aryl-sulfate sulfotransferase [Melioribacteraceae bacterium]MCF8431798.1 aryl-sulfate sulfotransferase [Melioribacteraceae bacterium]